MAPPKPVPEEAADDDGAAALRPCAQFPWERAFTVAVFAAIMALLQSDQNLLAPNMSAAAKDFGLTELQKDAYLGGYTSAGFAIAGAPSALICGYLTGRTNRVRLLFLVVIFGHGPCLAIFFASELWQYVLLRVLTGVAVGGVIPLVFSLLGDLFSPSQRSGMAAFASIALGSGVIGGQMMAALVGPATNWRVPYALVAVPSLLLATLMLLVIPDPPRGGFDEALQQACAEGGYTYTETLTWAKARQAMRIRSNIVIVLQGVPGWLPWAVASAFLNDYLSLEKGFAVPVATAVLLAFNVGGACGVIAGGTVGHVLYSRRRCWVVLLCAVCTAAIPGPLLFVINGDLRAAGVGGTMALAWLAGALAGVAPPNIRATVLNVNDPETRGAALALHSVVDDLGKGLGPILVAFMIEALGARRMAFNIAILGWVLQGLVMSGLAVWAQKDEAAVQTRLIARIVAGPQRTAGGYESRPSLLGGGIDPGSHGLGAGAAQPAPLGPCQHRLHRRRLPGSSPSGEGGETPLHARAPSTPGGKRFSIGAQTLIHVRVGRGSSGSGSSSSSGCASKSAGV